MKRILKRSASLMLVVLIMASLTTTALAANSTVTYTGNNGTFAFAPGSEYSLTDLFDEFKGVMPGDNLTEQVTVRNNANGTVYVKIYMRAKGAVEGSEKFLSQMTLSVAQLGRANKLFEAPADQTAQLTDWVLLGTFQSGANTTLDLTLNVPITMGNDFQDAVGELEWEFRAEEFPVPKGPPTGDDTPLALYAALLGGGTLLLLLLLVTKRRRERTEE